jgi:hypothetical protein
MGTLATANYAERKSAYICIDNDQKALSEPMPACYPELIGK